MNLSHLLKTAPGSGAVFFFGQKQEHNRLDLKYGVGFQRWPSLLTKARRMRFYFLTRAPKVRKSNPLLKNWPYPYLDLQIVGYP